MCMCVCTYMFECIFVLCMSVSIGDRDDTWKVSWASMCPL